MSKQLLGRCNDQWIYEGDTVKFEYLDGRKIIFKFVSDGNKVEIKEVKE